MIQHHEGWASKTYRTRLDIPSGLIIKSRFANNLTAALFLFIHSSCWSELSSQTWLYLVSCLAAILQQQRIAGISLCNYGGRFITFSFFANFEDVLGIKSAKKNVFSVSRPWVTRGFINFIGEKKEVPNVLKKRNYYIYSEEEKTNGQKIWNEYKMWFSPWYTENTMQAWRLLFREIRKEQEEDNLEINDALSVAVFVSRSLESMISSKKRRITKFLSLDLCCLRFHGKNKGLS